MGRTRAAAVAIALFPVLVTGCGVTRYLVSSHATDCLQGKGLVVTKGNLVVPKEVKGGTRKVPALTVRGGPKDHFAFGNQIVIVITEPDSDVATALLSIFPPPSFFPGAYKAIYRHSVAVWATSPTRDQSKLVDGCLR